LDYKSGRDRHPHPRQEGLALPCANIAALDRIMAWLAGASIRSYQTVGVKTVLSTDKYRPLVTEAKNFGFEISLLYVT
jgi:predicted ABC-type ATPase